MSAKLLKYIVVFLLLFFSYSLATAEVIDVNTKPGNSALSKISNIYSDIDMRLHLAIKTNVQPCIGDLCNLNIAFDTQVQKLGDRIAVNAYKTFPNLRGRVKNFTFIVVNKKEYGMASSGSGKIFIFRGIQDLGLDDDTLSFLLAREMGHVIGYHHNKNTFTKLILSALTSILFPVGSILSTSNFAAQTAATTIASATTSYLGSEVVISRLKPSQHIEADRIALSILDMQDWNISSVLVGLDLDYGTETNNWINDLKSTSQYLNEQDNKNETVMFQTEPESGATERDMTISQH